MLWLLIFLAIIILLCYVLWAPFYLDIESGIGLYRIRFHKLISLHFFVEEDPLLIKLSIIGWKKQIRLSSAITKKKTRKVTVAKKKIKISAGTWRAVFHSFKVNTFYLSLSFDDMALNGILYSWARWLKIKTGKDIEINFFNKNELKLELENNFFRIIHAYINS